jgi:hypothetical protein
VKIADTRFHQLARWLFLAAVLVLVPQMAIAHSGHDHGDKPVSQAVSADDIADAGQAQAPATSAAWSKSCPGGSGGKCCCGSSAISMVGGTMPVVHAGGWSCPAPPPGAAVALPVADASLRSRFFHSTALPRAPPVFS